jgi:transcription elongation factor Elf1
MPRVHKPRSFFKCPRCQIGYVDGVAKDTRGKQVLKCDKCEANVGIEALESQEREIRRKD